MSHLDAAPQSKSFPYGKLLLGCGGIFALVVIAILALGFYQLQGINEDPKTARDELSKMLNGAEIPAGFQGISSGEVFWVRTAIVQHEETGMNVIAVTESWSDTGAAPTNKASEGGNVTLIETKTYDVAGAPVEFTCQEHTDEGVKMLVWNGAIPMRDGRFGNLVFTGDTETFDVAQMEDFMTRIPPPPPATPKDK